MKLVSAIFILFFIFAAKSSASVFISEIMYDIEGGDDKKEWVEIYNDSASEVDLKDWRFNDGSNHILNEPPANGGRGSLILPAYGYAMLASDATTTVVGYLSYSGIVIDTVMSLGNTSEIIKIIDANGVIIDTVSYNSSMGANGDGKTLQKVFGSWIAAVPTPGVANSENGSSSSESVLPSSSQSSSSASSVANSSGGSIIWPDEQQIYANAGKDKTGIVGADVLFEGKALGIKKEPLENAQYLWNFGDGSSGEGQNVKHVYKYPDNYIAVLDVSSGQYSTSDRADVKISANELIVSEANNDFIKLKNKSGVILDISGWFLTGGGVLFKFPKSSFIAANAELNISSDISKIKFAGNDIKVNLLYSNGSVAFSYQNKKEIKPQPIVSAMAVSSSSQAKNIAQIIQPAKKPKPTTVVGFGTTTQLANVIYSSEENKNGNDYKKWFYLTIFMGIFSGGALFFVRRKSLS